ncbi:hypothetical protein SAMN05444671_0359 [Flavobacterium sp. CF108]|uniref:hypothetical protein n=1 Tax=unclassified Flavobacterium TaxID=196869 RepID=UPI0008BC3FBC|nr:MULTISPECIES: hypothetical protein [unclassified Flavobacterium]SEP36306.1 hypothetical protein SAMN04487978_0773 [Flavobacterium sp. fv08]SHI09480.1 hypothetical protein SAMN05444671_0359 [Flavobacterium sp. CF108]
MSEEIFPGPIQIPLATAEVWEKRYVDDTTIETRENKVKSFLIPRESLEKVLALETDAVRAYLGINDQKEKTLLFVGAQYDKETGKYVDVYGHSSSQLNRVESAEEVVYDGTRPSPPY